VRVLVTGADGFVGRHLVRRLLQEGDEVAAACRPGGPVVEWMSAGTARAGLETLRFEITDPESVRAALAWRPDAIAHLAAVASTREASHDPGGAWTVNAAGTARVLAAASDLRERGLADPLVLVVSTGEVYGLARAELRAARPALRVETDPLLPLSSYAASKLAAEVAALSEWRRTALRVVIARPFPHTGPGQTSQYVAPALLQRLREARRTGATTVPTGNLDPVRDLLDVQDVVEAYCALLRRGQAGEAYNIARGEGLSVADLFARLAQLIGVDVRPAPDPSLRRASDIPHLVGDSTKLRRATGWAPSLSLDETLRRLVDAEAD
jgi:GDP-4-dehydro-6-deoxy-D-mannose reductase